MNPRPFIEIRDFCLAVRITLGYRALGTLKRSRTVWFWIGSHANYDRLTSTVDADLEPGAK